MTRGAEQFVGRERRERVSQLELSGGACFDSRRRVNSAVRHLVRTINAAFILLSDACDSRGLLSWVATYSH
jgi:hypothetical protein